MLENTKTWVASEIQVQLVKPSVHLFRFQTVMLEVFLLHLCNQGAKGSLEFLNGIDADHFRN